MIENIELILEQEKIYGKLFFTEIIGLEYYVSTEEDDAYLFITFILKSKHEKERFKATIRYDNVNDYKVKNLGSHILLAQELWIIDDKNKGWEANKRFHVFDPDCDGEAFSHIEFYCGYIEVTSVVKL